MYLIISTSLSADSRSRIMARYALEQMCKMSDESSCQLIDLTDDPLPACDAGECYGHPAVVSLSESITEAKGILVAGPIYNYDLGAAAKNMIELTGKAWTDKVVGFLCAAGGQGSYMAPMGLANSLMLDFRSLILPRFVYATGDMFQGDEISDVAVEARIQELARQMLTVSEAVAN